MSTVHINTSQELSQSDMQGMLLSDDFLLSEYSIHPYKLLELHHARAYVLLPQMILSGLNLYSSSEGWKESVQASSINGSAPGTNEYYSWSDMLQSTEDPPLTPPQMRWY